MATDEPKNFSLEPRGLCHVFHRKSGEFGGTERHGDLFNNNGCTVATGGEQPQVVGEELCVGRRRTKLVLMVMWLGR